MDCKTFIVFNLNDRVLVGTWVGEWLGSVTSSQKSITIGVHWNHRCTPKLLRFPETTHDSVFYRSFRYNVP